MQMSWNFTSGHHFSQWTYAENLVKICQILTELGEVTIPDPYLPLIRPTKLFMWKNLIAGQIMHNHWITRGPHKTAPQATCDPWCIWLGLTGLSGMEWQFSLAIFLFDANKNPVKMHLPYIIIATVMQILLCCCLIDMINHKHSQSKFVKKRMHNGTWQLIKCQIRFVWIMVHWHNWFLTDYIQDYNVHSGIQ